MIVFATGGASCGKSAFCEELCQALGGDLVYLAAMQPFGEDGARRIARHRAMRAGKGFETVECFTGFSDVVESGVLDGKTALLECLGNVVANDLFSEGESARDEDAGARCARIGAVLEELCMRCSHVVVVGNEVACDGVAYPPETRLYQDVLGAVSRALAARADFVVECVSGCALPLKGFDAGPRHVDVHKLASLADEV